MMALDVVPMRAVSKGHCISGSGVSLTSNKVNICQEKSMLMAWLMHLFIDRVHFLQ